MKSASSLFAIAFGLMSFLKNLFVPQAMIRYLQKYFAYSKTNLFNISLFLSDICSVENWACLPKRDVIKDERCYTQDGKA